MNREIKFRAWLDEEEMVYDVQDKEAEWEFREHHPLMQFTGLKDKNGKEIYEGDLIQQVPGGYEPRFIYRVNWGNCHYRINSTDDVYSFPLFEIEPEEWRIIGNIHENPELLENK